MIDAKLSSHPIVQTVATPDQITAIFDSISYNKVSKFFIYITGDFQVTLRMLISL